MFNRFKTYIENEPWEEKLMRFEPHMNAVGWAVIVFSALYLGFGILRAVLQ